MKYDFIVVGHGLAGAILAHTLRGQGQRVLVIDEPKHNSASNVAAGLVNPIAGRRFAKTWMADEFIPAADAFYKLLEVHFGQQLYFHKPVYKIFSSIEEQNTWMARSAGDDWNEFILGTYTQSINNPVIHDPFGGVLIGRGGYLQVALMLQLLTQELLPQGLLLPERFDMTQLQLTAQGVTYKNIAASQLVFCEGYQVSNNPFFSWLPLHPNKGEVLELEVHNFNPERIYNKAVYVVPIGPGKYKVGATYNWQHPNEEPTPEGQQELTGRFRQMTAQPHTLLRHQAGIRPAVRDRHPLLGRHPEHAQLSVFNGMGSKGVLMAPYLATHFAAMLTSGTEVMPEVNISRYFSLYYDYIGKQS